MDKILLSLIASLWLAGCSSGGGGDDPVAVEPAVYYAETVVIANSTEYSEEHATEVYRLTAECMGYDAPEPPVIYVVDDLTVIWPEISPRSRGLTVHKVGANTTEIYVLPEGLNDGTLSHEFVHYIFFRNQELDLYIHDEHLPAYFADCRL